MLSIQGITLDPTFKTQLSPPVQLSILSNKNKKIFVAREDLLPGGTKQRAAAHYVRLMNNEGYDHFVYSSPFCGFAQVALSYVCRILNLNCTIVAERDPNPKNRIGKHTYTRLAESYGAQIVLAKDLSTAELISRRLCTVNKRYLRVPLGFDCPEYKAFLKVELIQQWNAILSVLPRKPKALWLPVGSGTLAQTFSDFVKFETRLHCVNVHVLPQNDKRIQDVRDNPHITLFSSPQPFAEATTDLPSIPSNVFYDAKLWHFIKQHAESGDVWWNVGR